MSFKTDTSLKDKLDRAAAHVGVSRSELIIRMITSRLKELDLWSIPGPLRLKETKQYESQRRKPRVQKEDL